MISPFRSGSLRSNASDSSRKSGEVMCSRHPRSWVEKKVFFVTKTRICPYCELESYAVPRPGPKGELEVPCEPGFGGTALPERRPSASRGTPRSRAGRGGGAPTPRPGRGSSTPRAGGRGRGAGAGAGTPRQRGQSQSPAPRTATVVRRTAVFKPTQSFDPTGRPPRGAGHGRSSSSSVPGGARGTSRSRHQRAASNPSGHRRSGSGSANSGGSGPLFTRSSRGGGGGGGFSREMKDLSPLREKKERFPAPLSAPSALAGAAKKKPARSLMFTSAARKRGGSGDVRGGGSTAASPQSVIEPPSPAGSSLSGFSAIGSGIAGGGGEAHSRRSSLERDFRLTLPPSIAEVTSAAHPPVAVVTVKPKSRGGHGTPPAAASTPTTVVAAAAASGTTTTTTTAAPARSTPARARQPPPAPEKAGPSPAQVYAAAVCLEPASSREQVEPAAGIVVRLADALEALKPEGVGAMGEAGRVAEAAGAALKAVKDANTLSDGGEEGGGDAGGQGRERVDEEEAEATGAVLAEAGDAVETFARTACALVWSGEDPSTLGELATYADRHRAASAAVSEAARRAQLLMDTLVVDGDTKTPREKAAAQRLWLQVLDRHEAWVRRRDSRKGLLMAEPEISAGSVSVFKDTQLLPKGTFGTTYAAEYLGMPVSATVLSISTSDPMAAVWSTASARLLRRSATSELRSLASHVPPHPRLARTHGNESVSAQAPLRVVNGDGGKEEPVALVLVGEMVEGGSLRGRLKSAGGAAAAAAEEGEEEAAGGGVAGEKAGVEAAPSASTSKGAGSSEEGAPTTPKASAPPQALRHRRVLADVAQGLAFLHERGVSHGALTADNVLLDAEGRAKLSLFGLAETRKAVEALKRASVSASEEWDALATTKTAASRVVAAGAGAWTAPEAWLALAGKQAATAAEKAVVSRGEPEVKEEEAAATPVTAAAADTPTDQDEGRGGGVSATGLEAADARETKKQATFAADAYAFGMLAWEVLTGTQPWEGLPLEEVSSRVCRGERPALSFEATSLEEFDGFGDLVRLLWAQDPTARPALQDVARVLRVPEPDRAPLAVAAVDGDQETRGEGVAPEEAVDADADAAADAREAPGEELAPEEVVDDDHEAGRPAAVSQGTEEGAVNGAAAAAAAACADVQSAVDPSSGGGGGHEQAEVGEGSEGGDAEPPVAVTGAARASSENGGGVGASPAGVPDPFGGGPAPVVGESNREETLGGKESDFKEPSEEDAVRGEGAVVETMEGSAEERGDSARPSEDGSLMVEDAMATTPAATAATSAQEPEGASDVRGLDAEIGLAQVDGQPAAVVEGVRAEEAGSDDAVSDLAPHSVEREGRGAEVGGGKEPGGEERILTRPSPRPATVVALPLASPAPVASVSVSHGSFGSVDNEGDEVITSTAEKGTSPAGLASEAASRQAAAAAAEASAAAAAAAVGAPQAGDDEAGGAEVVAETASACALEAPVATISGTAASSSAAAVGTTIGGHGDTSVDAGSCTSDASSSSSGNGTSAPAKEDQAASTSTGGGDARGSGIPRPPVLSPELSQLSVTSRGGATVVATPPPPPRQSQDQLEMDKNRGVTKVGAARVDAAAAAAAAAPKTPVGAGVGGRSAGASPAFAAGTPSRWARAGPRLGSIKGALSWFGKKQKGKSGGGGGGVTG